MGHAAFPMWDAIPTTESCEGTGSGKLLGWAFKSKGDQILWRSPRRGRWSLLDPDVFLRIGVATLLRRRIKNGSSRKYHSRSRSSICLPTELHNPSCILLNWVVFQQCSGIQCLLIGIQIADEISVKNLKAYYYSNSSLTRFVGSTKSNMKTWYPITMQLSTWQIGSKTSTSTMYRASKMRMQMHWHLSRFLGSSSRSGRESTHLQPWLVLSKTRPRKWSDSSREPLSQRNSRNFGKSRSQGLVNPVYRLRIVWHFVWWP